MDWIERLNKAIVHIDAHITEDIDYAQLAKIACCSSYQFQRMFSYIANVPLSEYIRRRKMSLAAVDLLNGDKVLDTALKYGYTSPTAFNRAFQGIHGIPPSQAKGNNVKSYPKINFKLIAKGVEEMEFRIEKHDAIRVVGISTPLSPNVEQAYLEGEALWLKVMFEGAPKDEEGDYLAYGALVDELNAAVNVKYPDGSITKYNGFFAIETTQHNGGKYMIAVASPMPESNNLKEYTIPAHTWAVFPGKNFFADEYSDVDAATQLEARLYSEWLPSSGYEIADDINVNFILPTNDLTIAPFEIWLPVKKATSR